jgi:hypothetical protein
VIDLEARCVAVLGLLNAVPNLDVFDGEPDANMDSDGKAHPYAAFYPSPGHIPLDEERMAGVGGPLVWSFQVTAAGGDPIRGRRAVTRVIDALQHNRLVPGQGRIRLSYDPGNLIVDRGVSPVRWYCPLMFDVPLS